MNKLGNVRQWQWLIFLALGGLLLIHTIASAKPASRPIWEVGLIGLYSNNIGQSMVFPITTATRDEAYNYQATARRRYLVAGSMLVGMEYGLNSWLAWQTGISHHQVGHMRAKGTFSQGADAQSTDQYSYRYN